MMSERIRVYFDYNVFDLIIRKQFFYNKKEEIDIFYSVAHVEEYFKAVKNDVKEENIGKLQEMKYLMTSLTKSGIILNPSKNRVVAKCEAFQICLDRVTRYDTRENVERNGEYLFNKFREKKAKLQEADPKIKNNSNLAAEDIWKRPEVIEELSWFSEYYEYYKQIYIKVLHATYGLESVRVLNKIQFSKEFKLEHGCFEKDIYSFSLLELVIEYLNNVLCSCGYHKDKNVSRARSGIHDVSHIIYSTYCQYFVSGDTGLVARANAIFEYLGLTTKAITINKFSDLCYK